MAADDSVAQVTVCELLPVDVNVQVSSTGLESSRHRRKGRRIETRAESRPGRGIRHSKGHGGRCPGRSHSPSSHDVPRPTWESCYHGAWTTRRRASTHPRRRTVGAPRRVRGRPWTATVVRLEPIQNEGCNEGNTRRRKPQDTMCQHFRRFANRKPWKLSPAARRSPASEAPGRR